MNTKLLFTLAMAGTASAAGPNADFSSRNLAAWGGTGGASSGNDDNGCKFLPISDLFAFHMDAYDTNTWTRVSEESQISSLASGMPIADFVGAEIHVASVDVVFSLDNYDDDAKTNAAANYPIDVPSKNTRADAKENYVYEKWDSSWSRDEDLEDGRTADGEQRAGTQKMATVCFYKPGYSVTNNLNDGSGGEMVFDFNTKSDGTTACGDADFKYPVEHTSLPNIRQEDVTSTTNGRYFDENTYNGVTPVARSIDSHKTLGVSTTCGTDDDEANSNIHDVFTWAVAKATGTLQYQIKVTIDRGEDNHNIYLANAPQNGDSSGNKATTPNIYLTVTLEQTHMTVPHDLLYISGNYDPGQQTIRSDQYVCNTESDEAEGNGCEDFTLQMEADLTGDVRWVDDDSVGETFDIKVDCTAELTVTSADGSWHCFDGAEGVPTSSNFDTSSNTVYQSSNGGDGTTMSGSGDPTDCTAYLTQQCVIASHNIHIEDSRHCYNVKDGDDNDEACADDEHKGDWPAIAPKSEVNFDAHAAIVEAIRLNNVRRYPLGDDATADEYTAKKVSNDDYTTLSSTHATSNSKFLCDDASGDCSETDPYVVLAAQDQVNEITVQCFSDDGSGSYGDPTDIQTGCDDDPYVSGGCVSASQHPVTCTTESPDRLPAGTDEVTLQLPPADFPQFYVFGISTLRSYQEDGDTLERDESNVQSDVTADHDSGTASGEHSANLPDSTNIPAASGATSTYDGSTARRLGARVGEPAQRRVLSERTSFVAARTAVASK